MTMSTQAIFDAVVAHFKQQRLAAFIYGITNVDYENGEEDDFSGDGENVVCCYRDDQGRKCAVGALIPDSLYHRGLEGACVVSDRIADALHRADVIDKDDYNAVKSRADSWTNSPRIRLLRTLQQIHDRAARESAPLDSAGVMAEMKQLAEDRNLAFNG